MQYNPAFGCCAQLIFLLFNQLQRHNGSRALSAQVKSQHVCFQEFLAFANDDTHKAQLESALKTPKSDTARALVLKLTRLVQVHAAMIPFSHAARKGKLSDFIAFMRHFGAGLWFNTISPDPTADLGAARATFDQRCNSGFPAEDAGYAAAARTGRPFECLAPGLSTSALRLQMPTDPISLTQRLTQHAVRSAAAYNADVESFFELLFGMPLKENFRRSQPRTLRPAGVFGVPTCAVSVTECNGKGWLHLHGLFTAGLPSWALQAAAGIPDLHDALCSFVDACVRAELLPEVHVQSLLRSLNMMQSYRGSWGCPSSVLAHLPTGAIKAAVPFSSLNMDGRTTGKAPDHTAPPSRFTLHAQFAAERTNTHVPHGPRCESGPLSETQCSQRFPRALNARTTCTSITEEKAQAPDSGPANFGVVDISANHVLTGVPGSDIRIIAIEPNWDRTVCRWELVESPLLIPLDTSNGKRHMVEQRTLSLLRIGSSQNGCVCTNNKSITFAMVMSPFRSRLMVFPVARWCVSMHTTTYCGDGCQRETIAFRIVGESGFLGTARFFERLCKCFCCILCSRGSCHYHYK
jgi:hypothetical protein